MRTTSTNTVTGLSTYFLDDVLDAHRSSYPANMTMAQFDLKREAYLLGMNEYNGCSFPVPSCRSIAAMFKAYEVATAARA